MEMINRIFGGWPLLRILRMALGLAALIQGIWTRDLIPLVFGLFLVVTAWMNAGCCGTRSCGPDGCGMPKDK